MSGIQPSKSPCSILFDDSAFVSPFEGVDRKVHELIKSAYDIAGEGKNLSKSKVEGRSEVAKALFRVASEMDLFWKASNQIFAKTITIASRMKTEQGGPEAKYAAGILATNLEEYSPELSQVFACDGKIPSRVDTALKRTLLQMADENLETYKKYLNAIRLPLENPVELLPKKEIDARSYARNTWVDLTTAEIKDAAAQYMSSIRSSRYKGDPEKSFEAVEQLPLGGLVFRGWVFRNVFEKDPNALYFSAFAHLPHNPDKAFQIFTGLQDRYPLSTDKFEDRKLLKLMEVFAETDLKRTEEALSELKPDFNPSFAYLDLARVLKKKDPEKARELTIKALQWMDSPTSNYQKVKVCIDLAKMMADFDVDKARSFLLKAETAPGPSLLLSQMPSYCAAKQAIAFEMLKKGSLSEAKTLYLEVIDKMKIYKESEKQLEETFASIAKEVLPFQKSWIEEFAAQGTGEAVSRMCQIVVGKDPQLAEKLESQISVDREAKVRTLLILAQVIKAMSWQQKQ